MVNNIESNTNNNIESNNKIFFLNTDQTEPKILLETTKVPDDSEAKKQQASYNETNFINNNGKIKFGETEISFSAITIDNSGTTPIYKINNNLSLDRKNLYDIASKHIVILDDTGIHFYNVNENTNKGETNNNETDNNLTNKQTGIILTNEISPDDKTDILNKEIGTNGLLLFILKNEPQLFYNIQYNYKSNNKETLIPITNPNKNSNENTKTLGNTIETAKYQIDISNRQFNDGDKIIIKTDNAVVNNTLKNKYLGILNNNNFLKQNYNHLQNIKITDKNKRTKTGKLKNYLNNNGTFKDNTDGNILLATLRLIVPLQQLVADGQDIEDILENTTIILNNPSNDENSRGFFKITNNDEKNPNRIQDKIQNKIQNNFNIEILINIENYSNINRKQAITILKKENDNGINHINIKQTFQNLIKNLPTSYTKITNQTTSNNQIQSNGQEFYAIDNMGLNFFLTYFTYDKENNKFIINQTNLNNDLGNDQNNKEKIKHQLNIIASIFNSIAESYNDTKKPQPIEENLTQAEQDFVNRIKNNSQIDNNTL